MNESIVSSLFYLFKKSITYCAGLIEYGVSITICLPFWKSIVVVVVAIVYYWIINHGYFTVLINYANGLSVTFVTTYNKNCSKKLYSNKGN